MGFLYARYFFVSMIIADNFVRPFFLRRHKAAYLRAVFCRASLLIEGRFDFFDDAFDLLGVGRGGHVLQVLFKGAQRRFEFLLVEVDLSQKELCVADANAPKLVCAQQLALGLRQTLQLHERAAEQKVNVGRAGINLGGLLQLFDRVGVILFAAQYQATLVVRLDLRAPVEARPRKRLAQDLLGPLRLARTDERVRVGQVQAGDVRTISVQVAEDFGGLRVFPLAVGGDAGVQAREVEKWE